ncbi:hypothetical protein EG856_01565 [Mycoplasmopsis phocirhinis]|uniref:DUF31 domain-containing protein n=1 Tax=Mycoplasmopsis phocirhinis TaxID=142650 RepID=A0A4P6MMA2_9BACT|nr:hypothetical protein [Mycoplasmopsis phocirhinis]QBF34608.1 hypothetical protein EG856_01565 [Mycoplasmopsis phocirhinis]
MKKINLILGLGLSTITLSSVLACTKQDNNKFDNPNMGLKPGPSEPNQADKIGQNTNTSKQTEPKNIEDKPNTPTPNDDIPLNFFDQIEGKNLKNVFNKIVFPKNIVLKNTDLNTQIIKNYFKREMYKSVSYVFDANTLDQIPQWMNFENAKTNKIKNIPDMSIFFNDQNNLTKYVRKIMPTFLGENEIKQIDANTIKLEKNISQFVNQNFKNKELTLYFIVQNNSIKAIGENRNKSYVIPIQLNIDTLLKFKGRVSSVNEEFVPYDANLPNLGIEYNARIDNDNNLIVELHSDENTFVFNSFNLKDGQIYIDKFNTLIDASYFTSKNADKNFSLSEHNNTSSLHTKLSSLENLYNVNLDPNALLVQAKRVDLPQNTTTLFDKIRQRTFSVGGGTMTMLAKVSPNNPNDYRFYFITNHHVSDILQNNWNDARVNKNFVIWNQNDALISANDESSAVEVFDSQLDLNVWVAQDQSNTAGIKLSNTNANADYSINIIDIEPLMQKAKQKNNQRVYKYLQNWFTLKPLKLSQYTNYITDASFVKLYLASFPISHNKNNGGRRYREHIINQAESIIINDQPRENEKYGHFKTFTVKDQEILNSNIDLISGASGSVVYDENGDMVAIFMQNIDPNLYGFGLLSSHEYDYLGFASSNNPNSFLNKLKNLAASQPDKYDDSVFN